MKQPRPQTARLPAAASFSSAPAASALLWTARLRRMALAWAVAMSMSIGVVAAAAAEPAVSPPVQVRTEYAQVLKVEPIYQTLRAYTSEERCDAAASGGNGSKPGKCRTVRVPREFRRVIAYDVDYIHRGVKYRSRLPFDPGKRLQVKVSVAPVLEPRAP